LNWGLSSDYRGKNLGDVSPKVAWEKNPNALETGRKRVGVFPSLSTKRGGLQISERTEKRHRESFLQKDLLRGGSGQGEGEKKLQAKGVYGRERGLGGSKPW